MNTKDENLLVKVIKKAIGLPTGSSSCSCGASAAKVNDCCIPEATDSASAKECGCERADSEQHEEESTQP